MAPKARLGGFKVLKDVFWFSLLFQKQRATTPTTLCRRVADEQINLPYITVLNDNETWGMNIAVDAPQGTHLLRLLQEMSADAVHDSKSVILSIFPHKNDPEITGNLLSALGNEGGGPKAWANSPSAISIVLGESRLNTASAALFGPFSFSAYRTPEDWKLAQKGKEKLYKEVVASYQEKQPKIYGLHVQENQELVRIKANEEEIGGLGKAFAEFGRLGLNLSFLTTGPCRVEHRGLFAFCLPRSEEPSLSAVVKGIVTHTEMDNRAPVSTFAMNGPHFGDRYGIASGLMNAFDAEGIELLGLNCTIASIIGVVPAEQTDLAIKAMQSYFEIPTILRKGQTVNE